MTLEELGRKYLDSVPALDKLLEKKTKAMKEAKKRGDFTKELSLKNEVRTIKDMRFDCLETGYRLINYYNEEVSECPKKY